MAAVVAGRRRREAGDQLRGGVRHLPRHQARRRGGEREHRGAGSRPEQARLLLLRRHRRPQQLHPRPHPRPAVHGQQAWRLHDLLRHGRRAHGVRPAPPGKGAGAGGGGGAWGAGVVHPGPGGAPDQGDAAFVREHVPDHAVLRQVHRLLPDRHGHVLEGREGVPAERVQRAGEVPGRRERVDGIKAEHGSARGQHTDVR